MKIKKGIKLIIKESFWMLVFFACTLDLCEEKGGKKDL